MKKIIFSDKFLLTQAVLEGRKTQTRRIIPKDFFSLTWDKRDNTLVYENGMGDFIDVRNSKYALYKVGEVVAVAQSYKDVDAFYKAAFDRKHSVHGMTVTMLDCVPDEEIKKWFDIRKQFANKASWNNKMFSGSTLMPHQIYITNVRVEKLKEISYKDCVEEGLDIDTDPMNPLCCTYSFHGAPQWYFSPREAFAYLINKVSGKDIWSENPYVFVYDFELVK